MSSIMKLLPRFDLRSFFVVSVVIGSARHSMTGGWFHLRACRNHWPESPTVAEKPPKIGSYVISLIVFFKVQKHKAAWMSSRNSTSLSSMSSVNMSFWCVIPSTWAFRERISGINLINESLHQRQGAIESFTFFVAPLSEEKFSSCNWKNFLTVTFVNCLQNELSLNFFSYTRVRSLSRRIFPSYSASDSEKRTRARSGNLISVFIQLFALLVTRCVNKVLCR